ncbi:hypothetical protein BWQ96_03283 [Gracilariopsis chorda]|uniref:Nucleotide-diphospho-sugar transferase domain-containing protein n=1 Tax=Gracilariopsis chorda TaxID=448386 RepID=A0A2V3IY03_9FLOR|nr:hypothetical protein BWQ96_03283 [Gracilariopsis chorda]|eukprot:PXF46945.1 hypothetical protein BWQ96_03283 [Gracilariopsis chorda]
MHAAPTSRYMHSRYAPPRIAFYTYLAVFSTALLLLLSRVHLFYVRETLLHGNYMHIGLQELPSLHFYTSPKPFVGTDERLQIRAIQSWLQLTPRPRITLLGDGPGYERVCAKFRLNHVKDVDQNFLQVPLLNSMFNIINSSTSDIVVFINADILLFDDFTYAMRKIQTQLAHGSVAVAARWDVSSTSYRPNSLSMRESRQFAVRQARDTGVLHTYGGIDLWAWHTAYGPLLRHRIPPFVFGRGRYDNWLTHQLIEEGKRPVIDISEAVTLVHVSHNYHLAHSTSSSEQQFWSYDSRSKFETYINSYLAYRHGSFAQQMGTALHAQFKLSSCYEPDGMCLFRRVRPAACRCEYSPFVHASLSDPFIVNNSRTVFCGLLSKNHGSTQRDRFPLSGVTDDDESSVVFGLPLVQTHLLSIISSMTRSDFVFVVVADFSERLVLSELVCSLRATRLFPFLIIAALDDELYQYGVTRGFPIYLSEFDNSTFSDYGTFKQLARYQVTYELLRLDKRVFSMEPALVFNNLPWMYFKEHLQDVDIALLPPMPELAQLAVDTSYISTSFMYARPTPQSLQLLRTVMATLEQRPQRAGWPLFKFSCGANYEGLISKQRCQRDDAAVVHLLDPNYFRPLEAGSCPQCSRRIRPHVLYVGSFSYERSPELAVGILRHAGINRAGNDKGYCTY